MIKMVSVYISQPVRKVLEYYGPLLYHYEQGMTIRERLSTLAEHLWAAVEDSNDAVCNEINNYHPGFIGQYWIEIKNNGFKKDDAFITIAQQYGYPDFREIPDAALNIEFERAIDLILEGQMEQLAGLLSDHPELTSMKSIYGHQATLLHYTANNGVELYRQVVPQNLPEIVKMLVGHGADLKAKMNVYGGEYTTEELMNTSAHPKGAGLYQILKNTFEELT